MKKITDFTKLTLKIGSQTFVKWFYIIFTGSILSLIMLSILFFKKREIILANSFFSNLSSYPVIILLFILQIIFFIMYIVIANKTAINTGIYLFWKNKASDFIILKVQKLLDKIIDKQPALLAGLTNITKIKSHINNEIKHDKDSSFLQRKLIAYALKKVNLDGITINSKEDLSSFISLKLENYISESVNPSMKYFYSIILIQIVSFFVILYFS